MISLSHPCGNMKDKYRKRVNRISEIYSEDRTCYFENENVNNSHEHPLFKETGFSETEFDVYNNNNLLNSIKNKMPVSGYNPDEL